MKEEEIIEKLKEYDYYYHTLGEPIISDEEYDKLKEELIVLNPKNPYLKNVGNTIEGAVKLPYYMGSLDKLKDEKPINNWLKKYKGEYIISDKLDGISCLICCKNKETNIYTRGNGINGRKINEILEYVKNIPKVEETICVRGELILEKKDWDEKYGSNARNVVAGLINSKNIKKEILNKVKFIVYDVIEPRVSILKGLEKAKSLGFEIVNIKEEKEINKEKLENVLRERKMNSKFEIDGIVIYDNSKEYELKAGENPKYAFAFKSMEQMEEMEVIVKDVEWNISKDGYIKPRILFEPIKLDGVMISATTGFNGLFIKNNKINKGSKITIIRSGGVIPKVQRIITKSEEGLMPEMIYKWNKTGVDIEIEEENEDTKIKEIVYFMKTLGIKNYAESTIRKLYENGYTDIEKLLSMKEEELIKIEGISNKLAKILITNVKDVREKEMYEIMGASNILGRNMGVKKLKLIYENVRDIFNTNYEELIKINGIGEVNVKSYLENIEEFKEFYEKLGIKEKKKEEKKEEEKILKEKIIVFTGFRDNELKKYIEERGGEVKESISKKTSILLVKSLEKGSGKIKEAKELGIKIMEKDKFILEIKKE